MNLYYLGADPTPPDFAPAIGDLLAALRDKATASWGRAQTAYVTLKKVRTQLGLPFIDDGSSSSPEGGTAASHGAWTTDLDVQAQDLDAMGVVIVSALNDAIAGKREVFYNDRGELAIRQIDSDLLVLSLDGQGVPVLVNTQGQPTHVESKDLTSATLGVPAIVWAATAGFSVLALPAYYVWDAAVNGLTDVAEQKTTKTIAEKSYECVQSGKCTPEQAAAINKSVGDVAAGIRYAKAAEAAANKPTDWTDLIKAATWFVGIGLVGYALIKFLPAIPAPSRSTKLLPAHAA